MSTRRYKHKIFEVDHTGIWEAGKIALDLETWIREFVTKLTNHRFHVNNMTHLTRQLFWTTMSVCRTFVTNDKLLFTHLLDCSIGQFNTKTK